MSVQGPIIVVSTARQAVCTAALDDAKMFPIIDTNWADASRAVAELHPAGVARIVVGRHQNTFMVPKAALLRNDETGTQTIVTMTRDSVAQSIQVNVGTATDSLVEVTGGDLREGMNVIIEGNYALPDSTKVTVAKEESR